MRKKKKRLQYWRRRGQTAVDPTVLDSFHQSGRRGGTSPQPKRKCEEIQPEAVFEDNVLYSPRVVTGPGSGLRQGKNRAALVKLRPELIPQRLERFGVERVGWSWLHGGVKKLREPVPNYIKALVCITNNIFVSICRHKCYIIGGRGVSEI